MDAVARVPYRHDPVTVALRPEIAAGGYASDDSTVEFFQRVIAVMPEGAVVLDLGAGSGRSSEPDYGPWKNWLLQFGHRSAKRIGVDIDPAVLSNPDLDEAIVIKPGDPLPFPAETFDIVFCDWVLEHIEDGTNYFADVHRILKPGGWFCARTPNRLSYFSIGARFVPSFLESKVLSFAQQQKNPKGDSFPKYYRLNSLSNIQRMLAPPRWINATYCYNPTPCYHANRRLIFRLIQAWQWLTPRSMGSIILIFARKAK